MVKVIVAGDCGNSPKNLFLSDFTVAIAKGDLVSVKKCLAKDVVWYEHAGQKAMHGRGEVINELANNLVKPVEFIIDMAISHGKKGVVNGTIKATNNQSYVFCDIFTFTMRAKQFLITEMTSYIIETKK